MDDEKPPESNIPQAPLQPSPAQAAKPADIPPAQPATIQQLAEEKHVAEAGQEISSFERATLRWARAAVLISILAAIFVCLQWNEMRRGGKDTHDLAIAAQDQAKATQGLAAKMQTQADRTKDLADRMKDQADQTKTIAKQATIQAMAGKRLARNATDTLNNTKQAFRDEQRAWVGVQGVADSKGFTETEPWQITVVFFNSGRTPARNVRVSSRYLTSPVPLHGPTQKEIKLLFSNPVQSIAPQGYFRELIGRKVGAEETSPLQLQGFQVLASQYNQIKSGQLFLYYFGTLTYDDNAGRSHVTEYCIYLADPSAKLAGVCDSFNDLY